MPVPASEAIASDVGHGRLGIRWGLRPFRDLLNETVGQRHVFIELRPKKLMNSAGWTGPGGSGEYYQAVNASFDGVTNLPIVGVRTDTEVLKHMEYGQRALAAGEWTAAAQWVYIRLTGDVNPNTKVVVVELAICVGSHGVYQPLLFADRMLNGSFDAWMGSLPNSWATGSTAGSLDKTNSDPLQGPYAARVTFSAVSGYYDLQQQVSDGVYFAGAAYRLSGAYRITGSGLSVESYVHNGAGSYMLSDGRTTGGAAAVFSDSTAAGDWRRFSFDFIVPPAWSSLYVEILARAASGTGTVDFDDVKLQWIGPYDSAAQPASYWFYEPRLGVSSVPTMEIARSDSFWGQVASSLGALTILNGNGYFEALIGSLDFLGADCIVRVGGKFADGGEEIGIEDCCFVARGRLKTPMVTDAEVRFDIENDYELLKRPLPTRTYNNNDVDAYQQGDRGRVRAMLFGRKKGIRPVQFDISYHGSGIIPFGKYEICDCADWDNWKQGIQGVDYVYYYTDEQAAKGRVSSFRTEIYGPGPDVTEGITFDLTNGRFTVNHDLHPLVVTYENNKIVFDIDGTGAQLYAASVTPKAYYLWDTKSSGAIVYGLLKDLQTSMRAVSGASDIYCTFVESTQKVQIYKSTGYLSLRCTNTTMTGGQQGLWDLLGFDASSDKAGALTYNADAVFTTGAEKHTIRCDAYGIKDDTAGFFTQDPSIPIQKAPAIAHFLLQIALKLPQAQIDVPSFYAAQSGFGLQYCSLYIGSERTVADVFEELETTGNFDLINKGGVWYCVPRDTSVPAGTPSLVDADYLAFESYFNEEDLFSHVTLTYNEAPDGGDPIDPTRYYIGYKANSQTEMGEKISQEVILRYGRTAHRVFRTCLREKSAATYPYSGSRLESIATQAQTKRRRFRFTVKGKCLAVPINGKIQITRTKGVSATGSLSNVLVRVLSKRDDWARWISEIEAIEVV